MTRKTIIATEQTSLSAVADLMNKHRIKRPLLRSDAKAAGIVSRADVVRAPTHWPNAPAGHP